MKRGYREAVKTPEGLELDLSAYGLHELPESLGIETTPGEFHTTSAPQTSETLEGKFTHSTPTTAHFQPASPSDLKVPTGNRSYRKSKRFLPLFLAVIIIGVVVLALAIPLALQLKKPSKQTAPNAPNSTTIAPNRHSTSGALNGTDLAVIALDQSGVPDISLFYQGHNLQIHRLNSIELSPFIDGFPVVASNARSATPMTSLTYPTTTGELNSHLYYVDINNILQEVYSSDNCTTWHLGSLGDSNFTTSVSSTALIALYSDHWLGLDGNSTGVRLYYGAPDNLVHELALFPSSTHNPSQYISQSVFRGTNGNAGIASAWSDSSGLANLYLFDQNHEFQIWSNDFNVTHNATTNTSYGNWVNDGPQTSYSVKLDTALASTVDVINYLCFQEVLEASTQIVCTGLESDGNLSSPSEAHAVTNSPLPLQGSALVAWWQAEPGADPWELNIFYQAENGDIIQDADANGPWVNDTVPTR